MRYPGIYLCSLTHMLSFFPLCLSILLLMVSLPSIIFVIILFPPPNPSALFQAADLVTISPFSEYNLLVPFFLCSSSSISFSHHLGSHSHAGSDRVCPWQKCPSFSPPTYATERGGGSVVAVNRTDNKVDSWRRCINICHILREYFRTISLRCLWCPARL